MQTVLSGSNLHEIMKPIFWENKKTMISLSSAEIAKRMVMVNIFTLNTETFYSLPYLS